MVEYYKHSIFLDRVCLPLAKGDSNSVMVSRVRAKELHSKDSKDHNRDHRRHRKGHMQEEQQQPSSSYYRHDIFSRPLSYWRNVTETKMDNNSVWVDTCKLNDPDTKTADICPEDHYV